MARTASPDSQDRSRTLSPGYAAEDATRRRGGSPRFHQGTDAAGGIQRPGGVVAGRAGRSCQAADQGSYGGKGSLGGETRRHQGQNPPAFKAGKTLTRTGRGPARSGA